MGYFNLMILLSRYIFAGFGILFIIVAFSFMKPFVQYTLGNRREKNRLLSICLYFFHLAGLSILMGKVTDETVRAGIGINGLIVLAVFIGSLVVLKMMRRQQELVLWQMMFFLIDIGFLMLERLDHSLAGKQVKFYVLGAIIGLLFPVMFSVVIKPQHKYIYLGILAIMMLLPFVFGDTIFGATNWVSIGPVSFQPSEIGKIALVLFLASTLSDGERRKRGFGGLVFPGAVTAVVLVCLVWQKDLGAVLLYYLTTLMMLLVATQSFLLPGLGVLLGAGGSVMGYFLFSHVRVRVEAFLHPFADINNTGYQVVQGLFSMGTWGWLGSGLTRGTPNKIPFAVSDYIFAAVCEEFGNLMGIIVLLCYLGIILLCLQVAFRYSHAFYRLVIVGIASLFGMQVFIIIGGVLKIIPLTGITTPFMSAGGSSIVVSMSMIGLITYFAYEARANEEKQTKERKEQRGYATR